MPRPARVHVEGGIYHVYNRLGRGERVFDREQHAESFVSLLRDLAQARELLVVLGVERYRLKLKDLARALGKSPDGMTKAVARAARRRMSDDGFRRRLDDLDRALTEVARD